MIEKSLMCDGKVLFKFREDGFCPKSLTILSSNLLCLV